MAIGRKDIIDMAAQAGFDDITPWLDAEKVDQGTIDAANRWIDKMISFAALAGFRVYEVEQEQCAAKVVAEGVAEYERGLKDGALLEREACAKACEEIAGRHEDSAACEHDQDFAMRFRVYAKHTRRCADAIRARGDVQL